MHLPLFGHVALCITFNTMYKGCFSILLINMKNGTIYDETYLRPQHPPVHHPLDAHYYSVVDELLGIWFNLDVIHR
jgi:hypothetical protein